jgi:transposase-like protein
MELAFGADTEHVQSEGFTVQPNTNLIERFHGTLKARTKVMRGLKNIESAIEFTDGWLVNYNFFRPQEALGNKTPAEVAKADFQYKSWKDVVSRGGIRK